MLPEPLPVLGYAEHNILALAGVKDQIRHVYIIAPEHSERWRGEGETEAFGTRYTYIHTIYVLCVRMCASVPAGGGV